MKKTVNRKIILMLSRVVCIILLLGITLGIVHYNKANYETFPNYKILSKKLLPSARYSNVYVLSSDYSAMCNGFEYYLLTQKKSNNSDLKYYFGKEYQGVSTCLIRDIEIVATVANYTTYFGYPLSDEYADIHDNTFISFMEISGSDDSIKQFRITQGEDEYEINIEKGTCAYIVRGVQSRLIDLIALLNISVPEKAYIGITYADIDNTLYIVITKYEWHSDKRWLKERKRNEISRKRVAILINAKSGEIIRHNMNNRAKEGNYYVVDVNAKYYTIGYAVQNKEYIHEERIKRK